MPQTTGIEMRQLIRDHDPRPFSSSDKPTLVLLPAPEMGGIDVVHCYPELEKAKTLARRMRRLPLLEQFVINNLPASEADAELKSRTFMGHDLSFVAAAIREKVENDRFGAIRKGI